MANDIQMNLNKFFENPSFSGKKIGVALSGGRDSVALAYALKTADIPLIAINVEHGIRGENSLKDSKFVADFAKIRHSAVEFFTRRAVVLRGKRLHDRARRAHFAIRDFRQGSSRGQM